MHKDYDLNRFKGRAYSTYETMQNTFLLSKRAIEEGIKGDFVECGVASGVQIGIMGYANQMFDGRKKIWAFDSYEGIPIATEHDESQPGIGAFTPAKTLEDRLVSSGMAVHSIAQVELHLDIWGIDKSQYMFVKGWFENTIPTNSIDSISVLRLDGDLYYSTKVCLEYLYEKVSIGGYIIIDDWALSGCRKACDEFFNYNNLQGPYKVDNSTPVWFKKVK